MVAYPRSPGVQEIPYWVINTWGTYSIVAQPPMFTYGLFSPVLLGALHQVGN